VSDGFLASLSLFGQTYGVGVAMAAALAWVGIWVVARDQIFLGAAAAQASTLGVALGLAASEVARVAGFASLPEDAAARALAVAASALTAFAVSRGRRPGRETAESLTGWVFLVGASLPVLLVAHSPHGLEEVQRLLFSTLLSVSTSDLVLFAGLAVATGGAALGLRDRLLLVAVDRETAAAVGLRLSRYETAVSVWLGLCVGLAIETAGLVYAFGCLVLPALVAKNACREARSLWLAAPALGVATSLAGFGLAYALDLPPAHASVALLAACLPASWGIGRLRARRA
jgi:ABC-type Mn2+/Zn2+ transport system permease subunit